jgi:osmotically-inducible protein OsmY
MHSDTAGPEDLRNCKNVSTKLKFARSPDPYANYTALERFNRIATYAEKEIAMRHSAGSIVARGLMLTLIMAGPAFAQSASESMHEAGKSAANAISHAYHGTATAVKDSTITAKVKTALHDDKITKNGDIHVTTVNGVVTLRGVVSSDEVAARAQRLARETTGVKAVENELKIAGNG